MSIYRRASGRYAVLVDLDRPGSGARRRRSIGTFATKKEAERAERAALEERSRGIDLSPDKLTVGDLLTRYVRERAALGRGAKTVERYGDLARLYVAPHLGSVPLAKLRPAHVADLLTVLRERGGAKRPKSETRRGLSPKTVSHVYALLNGAIAWAVRLELVGRNVCQAIETPTVPRREARAFTVEEAQRIVAAADATRWGPFVRFAVATGMRRGELLALRWADVDLERATVVVRASLGQTRAGLAEKSTKGDRVRPLALSPMASEALRRQRVAQVAERLAAGAGYADSGHVFQTEIGGTIAPMSATDHFRKLARTAKVTTTSLHACRHTAGTWLVAAGVDARTAAAVLGHANPSITLAVYSHVVAGAQHAAVALISDRFDSKKPG